MKKKLRLKYRLEPVGDTGLIFDIIYVDEEFKTLISDTEIKQYYASNGIRILTDPLISNLAGIPYKKIVEYNNEGVAFIKKMVRKIEEIYLSISDNQVNFESKFNRDKAIQNIHFALKEWANNWFREKSKLDKYLQKTGKKIRLKYILKPVGEKSIFFNIISMDELFRCKANSDDNNFYPNIYSDIKNNITIYSFMDPFIKIDKIFGLVIGLRGYKNRLYYNEFKFEANEYVDFEFKSREVRDKYIARIHKSLKKWSIEWFKNK